MSVPNAVFPSESSFDIPLLVLACQADVVDSPVLKWGNRARRRKGAYEGTVHFYTDDYRFSALRKHPDAVVNAGAITAVEPNFTCGTQTPLAIGLYHIWWKRWIARYWQDAGVRIMVDLNVAPKFSAWNMLGVPAGWSAYATRGYSDYDGDLDRIMEQREMAVKRCGSQQVLFMIYGGGREVRQLAERIGAVYVPEESDLVRGRAR